ncbi:galectin-9 isoform X2 [Chelonia mydas]|uniref:galectin-9 isoform X2 n=1 Tax=Chelonia mydas TaxID=8469 RepID=UPI0018A1F89B|nr:galectin-9 isoform X2 [Chelonia mydas]
MFLLPGYDQEEVMRFQIDFQCGSCPIPQADIAFHFNPRFEEGGYVVCNTFERQTWGREERKYEMPFFKGHPFEIRVLVKPDSFLSLPFTGSIHGSLRDGLMVIISGTVLPPCDRFQIDFQCGSCPIPQADIAFHFNPRFEEGGYVVCNTFERQTWGREERKYEMPFFKGHPFEIRVLVKPDSFLSLPFTGSIHGSLRDGLMVIISGTVLPPCDRFQIDFQCGSCPIPQADIAFHFNPRFEEGGYVVCNTFERQTWGREERKYEMPFFKGHPFEIRVLVKPDSFLSLPFTGSIHGSLRDGLMVIISGTVLPPCDRFQIDFQCGSCPIPQADIAFHFNPRFEEGGYVVCNTFERQTWGREERKYEMPFFKGHPFEIRVLVKPDSFLVIVNGKHFVEYKHRIPLSKVNNLSVSGGVEVAIISFQDATPPGAWCPRSAGITNAVFPPTQFAPGSTYSPQTYPVPYHTWILGGLYPSRSFVITGTIPLDADRFHVNLKWGKEIAFHLNPRFPEKTIVRNSFLNQCWGPEERDLPSGMPLSRGQIFTIWILCEARCFMVTVNGHHQFAYNHRVPNLQQIDKLEVEGDVMLTYVQV